VEKHREPAEDGPAVVSGLVVVDVKPAVRMRRVRKDGFAEEIHDLRLGHPAVETRERPPRKRVALLDGGMVTEHAAAEEDEERDGEKTSKHGRDETRGHGSIIAALAGFGSVSLRVRGPVP
jgi:hypothetical protein